MPDQERAAHDSGRAAADPGHGLCREGCHPLSRDARNRFSISRFSARLSKAEKSLKKLAAAPDVAGVRRHFRRLASGAFDDELRATAQGFTSGARAMFVVRIDHPPSLMLAVSRDSGFNAGQIVKEAVTAAGGRGGGSPTAAQGSVPDAAALDRVEQRLRAAGVIAG